MVVIWGLNLNDMRWSAFKSSYMFGNTDYHLRRTKFVVYQCAMIFCVVSESLGTAVLSDYVDQQNYLQRLFPNVDVFNDDYVGIASYNIFIGVMIATVFGAAFFFDLFFPLRYEPRWVQITWLCSAVFVCVAGLADALAYTIIVSLRGESLSGGEKLSDIQNTQLLEEVAKESTKTPLLYRDNGRAIGSVVLLWIGWVSTIGSTVVMFMFYSHVRRYGTAHAKHIIAAQEKLKTSDIETPTIDNADADADARAAAQAAAR